MDRIRIPPRRRWPDSRIGFLRAEQQMPRWIGAEGGRIEPVGAVVFGSGEPAGQPKKVGTPGEAGARRVEQPLGVGDELAECLSCGGPQLLRARRAVIVVPVRELLPVRACP